MSLPTIIPSHVFGLNPDVRNNVNYIDEQTLVYPAGTYLVVYNIEQKSQRFVPISDGDGITCISLNHNCGYAAVAVKGDRPAVIVCDMHALKKRKIFQAPEGIQAKEFINVAFSNDGKYVFAQSNGPDWSIYYWSWDKAKLVGSFKSTNNVNSEIHQMSLDPYDSAPHLCVTGSSVFRLFRYVEGGIKLIAHQKSDRNLLTHSWVSDMRVVVGTEDAKLLIFEGGDLVAEVTYTMAYNPNVVPALRSVVAYSGGLIVGTSVGTCVLFERVDEVSAGAGTGTGLYKAHKEFLLEDSIEVSAIALSPSEDSAVCTLVNSQIYVIPLDADASRGEEIKCERLCQPFHTGSIVGLDTCARKPLIATCGTDRTVRIWNYVENAIEVVKYFDDEPQSIAIHPSGLYVLVGFKEALKLMNVLIDDIRPFWTSNIRGCRECRFSNGGQYFASVYGSTVGIHSTWSFDTICNLKGHSGKVRSICWSQDDSHLITCGLDGCIYEWNVRTTRKESEVVSRNPGAPSTAGPAPGAILYTSASYSPDPKIIYAVSSDCMLREISDSHILREIPTKVQYTHLVQSRSGKMFAATSRGAVRALKYPIPAEPQTSDYVEHVCHSTAITRMRLSFDEQYLFTVADDGCVWIYRVQEKEVRGTKREKDWSYSDEILVTKSDLKDNVRLMNELRQRVEDLRSDNETQLRLKDLNYTEKLRELTEKYVTEIEALKQTTLSLKHEREKNQTTHQKELSKTKTQNHIEIKELEQNFSAKMEAEAEKYSELQKRTSVLQSQWESQMELMEIEHRDRVGQMTAYFQEKLQEKQNQITDIKQKSQRQAVHFQHTLTDIEADGEQEITQIQHGFERKLSDERRAVGLIHSENLEMRGRFERVTHEIDEHKMELAKMFAEEKRLHWIIKGLEKDIVVIKREMQERDDTIQDKEKRIYDLKKKNQELEKFKFVLDYKIMELKKQVEPREMDIVTLTEQIKSMDQELHEYHRRHGALDTSIQDLHMKLHAAQKEVTSEQSRAKEMRSAVRRIRTDTRSVQKCLEHEDIHALKKMVVHLFRKYDKAPVEPLPMPRERGAAPAADGDDTTTNNPPVVPDISEPREDELEMSRQREHLERTVNTLRQKLKKAGDVQHNENLRIVSENVTLLSEVNLLRKHARLSPL